MPSLSPWTRFVRGSIPPKSFEEMDQMVRELVAADPDQKTTEEDARKAILATLSSEIWINSRYQVNITRQHSSCPGNPDLIHLSIKRRDKVPVGCEHFRDFQRIKNELIGPDAEFVEIYPAESRLVDTSNQYHMWGIDDPSFRFPFGYDRRLVVGPERGVSGSVQQPFDED